MEIDELYDLLVEYSIATPDEINLVTSINGWDLKSLLDILYVRTGYSNWYQFAEENGI